MKSDKLEFMQSVKASCKFMEGTILGEMQIDNKKSNYIKWICENFNCNQDIECKNKNDDSLTKDMYDSFLYN